jgi:hypothetical protein
MASRKSPTARKAPSAPVSSPDTQALAGLIAAARLAVADFGVLAAGFDALGHHTSAGRARTHAQQLLAALEKAQGFPEPRSADAPLQVGDRVRDTLTGATGTVTETVGYRDDHIKVRMDDPRRGVNGYIYPRASTCQRIPASGVRS